MFVPRIYILESVVSREVFMLFLHYFLYVALFLCALGNVRLRVRTACTPPVAACELFLLSYTYEIPGFHRNE